MNAQKKSIASESIYFFFFLLSITFYTGNWYRGPRNRHGLARILIGIISSISGLVRKVEIWLYQLPITILNTPDISEAYLVYTHSTNHTLSSASIGSLFTFSLNNQDSKYRVIPPLPWSLNLKKRTRCFGPKHLQYLRALKLLSNPFIEGHYLWRTSGLSLGYSQNFRAGYIGFF